MNGGMCVHCNERPGEIWLCGEGNFCEPCFRELGGVPDDVEMTFDANLKLSAELDPYIEQAQARLNPA